MSRSVMFELTKVQEAEARLARRQCMLYTTKRTNVMVGNTYRCGGMASLSLNTGRFYMACEWHGPVDWFNTEVDWFNTEVEEA